MKGRTAFRTVGVVLSVAVVSIIPIIPINLVLRDELPPVVADEALSANDVQAIVTQARGGKYVSLAELLGGRVNKPFTDVEVIRPENIPYAGSIEDQSDVVVGYGSCIPESMIAQCSGYRVYLRRTASGWEVLKRHRYIT